MCLRLVSASNAKNGVQLLLLAAAIVNNDSFSVFVVYGRVANPCKYVLSMTTPLMTLLLVPVVVLFCSCFQTCGVEQTGSIMAEKQSTGGLLSVCRK